MHSEVLDHLFLSLRKELLFEPKDKAIGIVPRTGKMI